MQLILNIFEAGVEAGIVTAHHFFFIGFTNATHLFLQLHKNYDIGGSCDFWHCFSCLYKLQM